MKLSLVAATLCVGLLVSSSEEPKDGPMVPFERMMAGEWRVRLDSGTSQFDTFEWGPGKRSVRMLTDGFGAEGEPWQALEVWYWHAGKNEVRLLRLSPFARGVGEGAMTFDGETADAVFDLHQTWGRRELVRRWVFELTSLDVEVLVATS